MGGKIFFILMLVVVLGVALYVINSGVLEQAATGLGTLLARSTSTSSSVGSPGFTGPSFGGPTYVQPPGQTPSPSPAPTINPADIPAGFTAAQLSPYFHQVRFNSISAGTIYNYGTISIGNSLPASTSVDITGWQIKSKNSGEYIPQAINNYDASGLTPASDIRVTSGDYVYLYSSSAPFNLRLNKCIGYVAHVANFNPPIPSNCPYIDQSRIQNFTGACQNYINSIGSCQAPNMSDPRIPQNDYSCINYLENNFTYKSCVDQHQSDPDFLSHEIRVWTGSNVVDQYHDSVQLLDRNGLLVDLYTY